MGICKHGDLLTVGSCNYDIDGIHQPIEEFEVEIESSEIMFQHFDITREKSENLQSDENHFQKYDQWPY